MYRGLAALRNNTSNIPGPGTMMRNDRMGGNDDTNRPARPGVPVVKPVKQPSNGMPQPAQPVQPTAATMTPQTQMPTNSDGSPDSTWLRTGVRPGANTMNTAAKPIAQKAIRRQQPRMQK